MSSLSQGTSLNCGTQAGLMYEFDLRFASLFWIDLSDSR